MSPSHSSASLIREARLFALIGAVGFCVDGGLLLLGHRHCGLEWPLARLLSFTAAASVTWLLNRRFTFSGSKRSLKLDEWRRYLTVNGVGAILNLGIFMGLVGFAPAFRDHPLVALAIAAAIALAFNFLGSRRFAFGLTLTNPGPTHHD